MGGWGVGAGWGYGFFSFTCDANGVREGGRKVGRDVMTMGGGGGEKGVCWGGGGGGGGGWGGGGGGGGGGRMALLDEGRSWVGGWGRKRGNGMRGRGWGGGFFWMESLGNLIGVGICLCVVAFFESGRMDGWFLIRFVTTFETICCAAAAFLTVLV